MSGRAMFASTGSYSLLVGVGVPYIILISLFNWVSTKAVWWLAEQTGAQYYIVK